MTEMTMKNKLWYCQDCAVKEKCMECKKYVSPDMGKADDYGAWFCFNCWKKYTAVCHFSFYF